MTNRWVLPGVVHGELTAPPSKSYTHRALVAAALSDRRYRVRSPLDAEDTLTTASGLHALGYPVVRRPRSWTVYPRREGPRGPGPARVNCARSGTSLRFLTVLAARGSAPVQFLGDPELVRRPMGPLLGVLRAGKARVTAAPTPSGLPFEVRGPLQPVHTRLGVDESSQFLSALLLVLPRLDGPSRLELEGDPVSWEYVRATRRILSAHGVRARVGRHEVAVPGNQRFHGSEFEVPGDASSAAYLWAAAAASGGRVRVRGVDRKWPQADLRILPLLREMGAQVSLAAGSATVTGGGLERVDAELTDCPDLYPLVGALAAIARGTSWIRGAPHVVFKESNRLLATIELVKAIGGRAVRKREGLQVEGTTRPRALRRTRSQDHRVVMATAVAALAASGRSLVGGAEAVEKSFPEFWSALAYLGIRTWVNR